MSRVFGEKLPSRPVLKYYLYRMSGAGAFHVPIDVLLFRSRGLTFEQIGILTAFGAAVTLVMEVPSGYVGDRIGRRNTLLMSEGLVAAGSVVYAFAPSFGTFLAAKALYVLGLAFYSGAADAWLYDTLSTRDKEDAFARVSGRGQSASLVVMGVSAVVGGYLGEIDFGLAYLATAAGTTVAFLVVLTFPKTIPDDDDDQLTLGTVRTILRDELLQPRLRAVVATLAGFFGVITTINGLFVQPVSVDAGVSVGQIGWLFAGFTTVSAIGSYLTAWVKRWVGTERAIIAAPFVVGVGLGAVEFLPVFAIPAFFLMRGTQRVIQPLSGQFINDRLSSVGRATALSVVAMVYAVVAIPLRLVAGRLGGLLSPVSATALAAVPLIAIGGYLLVRLSGDSAAEAPAPSD